MDRDRILGDLAEFHRLLLVARGKRGKEMLFAINRVDRKLDRVGTGYERYFTNITFSDVARFCKFDICHNNIFTMGSTVLRQVRGIAIGGTGSAQLANISLFVAEHHH